MTLSRTHTSTKGKQSLLIQSIGYWHQRADERNGNPPPR